MARWNTEDITLIISYILFLMCKYTEFILKEGRKMNLAWFLGSTVVTIVVLVLLSTL